MATAFTVRTGGGRLAVHGYSAALYSLSLNDYRVLSSLRWETGGRPQTKCLKKILVRFSSLHFPILWNQKESVPSSSLPSLSLFNMLAKFSLELHCCQPSLHATAEAPHRRLSHPSLSLAAHNVGWQPTNELAICTRETRLQKVVLGRTCCFRSQKWATCHCH